MRQYYSEVKEEWYELYEYNRYLDAFHTLEKLDERLTYYLSLSDSTEEDFTIVKVSRAKVIWVD